MLETTTLDAALAAQDTATDAAYIMAQTSDGQTVKISKADLASVVAGYMGCGEIARVHGKEVVVSAPQYSAFTLLISGYGSVYSYTILVSFCAYAHRVSAVSLGQNPAGISLFTTSDDATKLVIKANNTYNDIAVILLGDPMERKITAEIFDIGTTTDLTSVAVTNLQA